MVTLSTMTCGICEAATVNAYLCSHCEDLLRQLVIRAGVTYTDQEGREVICLLDELDVQMSRQSRAAPRFGGRSADTPLPFDAKAAKAHSHLCDELTRWSRHYGAQAYDLAGPRRCAHWLRLRIDQIVMSADSESFYQSLKVATGQALAVLERPGAKAYVGICSAPLERGYCSVDLYAEPDAIMVTCPRCGSMFDVKGRRDFMLAIAEDVIACAVDIARAVSSFGMPVSPSQIYKWKLRGKLFPLGVNSLGDPTYRLGDVLELARRGVLRAEGLEG